MSQNNTRTSVAPKQLHSIDDLRPAPYNPRRISDEAATGLGYSLERFGDISGLVWNSRSGHLVAGHQRLAELRKQGARLDGEALVVGDRCYPVRVVDWDDATERAANLSANNQHIAGEWTPDLAGLIEEVKIEIGEEDFGGLRLDRLVDDAPALDGETKEDEAPELPTNPVTKPGDVWTLGDHRIACGDSGDAVLVGGLCGDNRCGLMNTDPPYGVNYAATKDGIPRSGFITQQRDHGDVLNDDLDGPKLQSFLERIFNIAREMALKDDAAWYLWHAHLTQGFFAAAAAAADVMLHRQIIWSKAHMVLTRSGMYHWKHEPCFFGWVRGHRPPWYGSLSQTSVWELAHDGGERVHQNQKPVELFAIPQQNHLRRGEFCYEPFSGSGSQIIAAEQVGVRCLAVELDPGFVDVAVERWENLTGKKATRTHA